MARHKGSKAPNGGFRDHPENINRKGRPRVGLTFAERVRAVLEEDDPAKARILVEDLIAVAVMRAKKGNFQFWDALMNRAYGKVMDKVEMSQEQPFDPSKLNDAELDLLKSLLAKARP